MIYFALSYIVNAKVAAGVHCPMIFPNMLSSLSGGLSNVLLVGLKIIACYGKTANGRYIIQAVKMAFISLLLRRY